MLSPPDPPHSGPRSDQGDDRRIEWVAGEGPLVIDSCCGDDALNLLQVFSEDGDIGFPQLAGVGADFGVVLEAIKEGVAFKGKGELCFIKNMKDCLIYTSPSPRDGLLSRMPSSA